MDNIDLSKLVAYSKNGPAKKVFYDRGNLKAQLVCLKAGQIIPPCKMTQDVLFFIVKGNGKIKVDGKITKLKPLISVVVPREAKTRSISAGSDLVILAVQGRKAGDLK